MSSKPAKRKPAKKFEKLSAAEKRVQIAHDVLEQIRIGRIKPKSGYWVVSKALDKRVVQNKGDQELQGLLKDKHCSACALGSMFVCAVDRTNKFKVKDIDSFEMCRDTENKLTDNFGVDYSDIANYIGKYFNHNQLVLIETAFEQGEGQFTLTSDPNAFNHYDDHNLYNDCINFCEGKSATVRLQMIMENIIQNGGMFVPPRLYMLG